MRASLRSARAAQLAVAAVSAIGLIDLFESSASGAGCDNSWLTAGSGDWFADGNWSAGHSPTEGENVCIEVDGDYTVVLVGGETVASLSIGSTTTTGTQRLAIGVSSQGGSLTAPGGVVNGAQGEIFFDSNRHSSSIHTANSTLVNNGAITMSTAPGLEAGVAGNLRNAASGVIHVDGSMGFYSEGGAADTLLNRGQIEVADGATLINRRSSTITNDPTGHISSTGTGQVVSGTELDTTFNQAGTTLGPAPVRIYGGTLNYTGDGASHVEAEGQFILTGTLSSGQSLKITDANANAFGGFTNAAGGDLRIHSRGFTSSLNTSDAPLVNRGTITLTGAGTPGTDTALFGPVTNAPGGLVRAEYNLGLYTGGAVADTFLNQGRLEAADGVTVIVRRSATFTNAASGHIEGEGTGHVLSGAELDTTFNEAGTTDGSRPVVVVGGTLNYTGNRASDIEATGQFALNGTLRPGQGLTIADGHANASASGFVNDGGQMRIEAFGVSSSFNVGTNTLLNDGTVRAVGGSGVEVQLFGDIDNPGTIDLQQNTGFFPQGALATLTNEGQLTIANGKTLDLKRSSVFEQSAGRTTLDGATSRLAVFDAPGVTLTGGILEGTGTVAANVTNGGEVRPGTSPGTLNVDGAYTQTPDGVLVGEVTAAGNDLLDATGAATLDGTLEIETEAGFTPALGDLFKVVEGSSRTGEFADVNGIGGGPYEVLYNPADVTLRTIDPSDLPAFTIDDVTVREGDAGTTDAAFRVRLSETQSTEVTVDFRTANGSAREPGDYTSAEGTLRFPPGVVQRSAVVPVVGDDAPEADEDFQVNLRNADGAQIADGRGIGTIENDELDAVLVTPNRGGDACCITVTVHGAGFVPGVGLRLQRAGEPDVVASRVRVADDGRSLAGLLNLAGRPRAAWDVTVANPAGRGSDTLLGAFTVEAVRAPSLWMRIDGGGVARPEQPYTAMLAYGNTGNVDATGVMIQLSGVPSFDRVDIPDSSSPPGLVFEGLGDGRGARIFSPRVAPGTSYVPVQPRFELSRTETLRGRIFGDQFDEAAVPTLDPATQVTMDIDQATDPATASPAVLRGTYQVSGPGGGAISFSYTATNAAAHAAPAIERTQPSAGVVRFHFRATTELNGQIKAVDTVLEGPASAFEALRRAGNVGSAARSSRATTSLGALRTSPLEVFEAHAESVQYVTRAQLIDCLLHPPNGRQPLIDPITLELLNNFSDGGATAGVLGLVPASGAVGLAWGAVTAGQGFVLGEGFNDVVGRALGDAARFDASLPQWQDMINEEDRIASFLVFCAPPPPPATPPPYGGGIEAFKTVRVTNSRDPNEKAGPDGFGAQRYIEGDEPLPYTIKFENVASATAPAQVVRITDQLDPAEVRLGSASLGPVHFGDVFAGPPAGLKHWTTDIDLRPEKNLVVRVKGDLDATGLLTWEFTSLDPDTLQPTTDPLAGFLPPNDIPPEGEGAVYFSASPADSLASGDAVDNSASIVFDTNAPIVTNTWLNTIDDDLPTSRVSSVTRTGGTACVTDLAVAWSGSDAGSGIGAFDVYASVDGGPYGLWRSQTTKTGDTYPGEAGHTYGFYTLARDRAGHSEAAPAAPDASATVSCETTPPPGEPPANPDRDAPETTITKRPAKKTTKRKAKFTFESDDSAATFECKLDRKQYKPCRSPRKYKVKPGKHKFLVRAIDAAGNTDPSPAKVKFRRLG